MGNVQLLAGECFNLGGFGFYDGKYIITRATHELSPYKTSIEGHKVLNGY